MIIKRLFEILFENQLVLVTTSNRPPQDLYKNGLQRVLFLPFIPILTKYCQVHNMSEDIDHRYDEVGEKRDQGHLRLPTWVDQASNEIEVIKGQLTKGRKSRKHEVTAMSGRKIMIEEFYDGTCCFTFDELIEKPFGTSDFIPICREINNFVLKGLRPIDLNNKNVTRRFILLIDEIYNHRVKLYTSSTVPLSELFTNRGAASSSEENFMIERAISRLTEMQTDKYLNEKTHLQQESENK